MYQSEPSVQDLLRCFFTECKTHFGFLEHKHDFRSLSGLIQYHKNYKIIRPWTHNDTREFVSGDGQAVMRFERGDIALEICFSKARLAIEGYVYFDPVQRFEFTEILTAAKKDEPAIAGDIGLSQAAFIRDTLANMAMAFRKYKRYFITSNEKLIDRAHMIRSKRIEQAVREHFKSLLEENSAEAARAFAHKDFKRVIELLQPYEPYLNNADIKKLTLARKSMLDDLTEEQETP